MKRFRGGLVFKTHRLLYYSTLGLRVIKKKKRRLRAAGCRDQSPGVLDNDFEEGLYHFRVSGFGFRNSGCGLRGFGIIFVS